MHLFASTGLLLIVLGLSGGAWHFWERNGDALIPAGRYVILAGILCSALATFVSYLRGKGLPSKESFLDGRVWACGLLAIFFSDWITRPWGLFKGPAVRGELLLGAFICFLFLRRQLWIQFFMCWPFIAAGLLIWSFTVAANGFLLFSDDHAMFLFRLKLLKENFPSIPFWSPLWNAGIDARDFFATGALNAFLLGAPLIYAFPVEIVYPVLIGGILWILAPACVFLAARLLGLPTLAAALSTTLSLCSGIFWFRWALKYGTVGFITSTALFPLVAALAITYIRAERPSLLRGAALCISATLMLLWSPSGIAAAPILLVALPHIPRLLRSKRHVVALCVIIALNLPWVCMMWKVSKVGRFLDSSSTQSAPPTPTSAIESIAPNNNSSPTTSTETTAYRHKRDSISFKEALNHWQSNAVALNPLLVILALPALIAFTGVGRVYVIALCTWLLLLGTVGVSLKPQLELDRMIVIASILVTIPVGQYLFQLFLAAQRGLAWRIAASCAGAFVLIGPFAATSVVLNRSDDTYTFANREVHSFSRALSNHASGGRVVFTGCVLHQMSGGHLAPLPMWSNTPMIASSYAHNIWKYEQPIPQQLIARGDTGINEYLDLVNASVVVAHEPKWIEYFKARQADYQQVWRGEVFFVFKRAHYTPSYAISGALSDLSFTSRDITFIPKTESLVLKFRHFPFIKASSCVMDARPSAAGFDLIALSGCTPGQPVTIRSVSPAKRLLGSS